MDNSDLTPPKPLSLSDEQLELALEEAKKQGDGMIAAMVLLEQQAQLREQDERAYAEWVAKQASTTNAGVQAAATSVAATTQELQPIEAEKVELAEPVPFESQEKLPESIPAPQSAPEAEREPEPIPAPVSQEVAFDELLALGSDAATDSIATLPDDFSVTGVVEQIVEQVETDFSASADEDATALEESAHTPVAAFEPEAPEAPKAEKQPGRHKAAFAIFWNQLGLYAVATPLLVAAWAASTGASVATVLTGSLSGLLLSFGLNLISLRAASRSTKTHTLTSRATFGVFGNILPTLFNTSSRLVLLALLATAGVGLFDSTISGAAPFGSAVLPGIGLGTILASSIVVIAALVVSVSWLRKYLVRVAFSAALVWILVVSVVSGFAPISFGNFDTGGALLIALVVVTFSIATVGLANSSPELTGAELNRTGVRVAGLLSNVVVPAAVILVLSTSLVNTVQGRIEFDATALSAFFAVSPAWLATSALWVLIPLVLVLLLQAFEFAAESLQGFFLSRAWLSTVIVSVASLALLACGQLWVGFNEMLSGWLILALLGPAIWAGAYLTQSLMRLGDYHEVSLMRSYAFYKPVSVFALFGYLAVFAFSFGITDVPGIEWSGLLSRYVDSIVIFGNFSGIVLGFLAASVWTLITSLPRVRSQEREVAAVDERRSEIAGVELPE